MTKEERLLEVISNFKGDLKNAMLTSLDAAYSEVLPHIEDDTIMNVEYRSQRVIENMISGKFERVDETTVSVKDDNDICVRIRISDGQWDYLRASLLEAMPACPKDLEIAQLKKQIEWLNKQYF